MSEAKDKAALAAKQAKHAVNNGASAASAAGEAAVDSAAVLKPGIKLEINHLGKGYLALSVAASAATIAFVQFKKVWDNRSTELAARGRKVG